MQAHTSRPIRRSPWAAVLVLAFAAGHARAQTPPELPAAPPSGSRLFLDCAACHGADGSGVSDGSVPAIGGQPAAFVRSALDDFRAHRRDDIRMRHFSDPQHLADAAELDAVAAQVASLRRGMPATTGDGSQLDRGRSLFARHCAGCHGAGGAAAAQPPRPALAGQHAPYLERKMLDTRDMRSSQSRRHAALAGTLGEAGVSAVADWLSRQPPP